jgi:hypothetical protein
MAWTPNNFCRVWTLTNVRPSLAPKPQRFCTQAQVPEKPAYSPTALHIELPKVQPTRNVFLRSHLLVKPPAKCVADSKLWVSQEILNR